MGEGKLSIHPGTRIMVINGKYKGSNGHVVRCTSQRAWVKLVSLNEKPTVCLAKKSFVVASHSGVSSNEVPCLVTETSAKQPINIPSAQPNLPKLGTRTSVLIMEGQYLGKFGVVVKETPAMAYIQFDGLNDPVLISKKIIEAISSPQGQVPFISPPDSNNRSGSGIPPSELRPRKIRFGEGISSDNEFSKNDHLRKVGGFVILGVGVGVIAILIAHAKNSWWQ